MYRKILVALDHTASDETLLVHIMAFAVKMSSELLLLHVADGWVARNFEQLNLAHSEEMQEDWKYLEQLGERLRAETSLTVEHRLALGNPPVQILHVADVENCDLIALATHGHRLVGDIIHGSTIDAVRHRARVPLLVVPAKKQARPES